MEIQTKRITDALYKWYVQIHKGQIPFTFTDNLDYQGLLLITNDKSIIESAIREKIIGNQMNLASLLDKKINDKQWLDYFHSIPSIKHVTITNYQQDLKGIDMIVTTDTSHYNIALRKRNKDYKDIAFRLGRYKSNELTKLSKGQVDYLIYHTPERKIILNITRMRKEGFFDMVDYFIKKHYSAAGIRLLETRDDSNSITDMVVIDIDMLYGLHYVIDEVIAFGR